MAKLKIENRYAVTPNELLNDPSISLKAKGLFGFIQSKPDGWDFSAERIALQTKDGRDGVQVALRELENYGYLIRKRYQDDKGFWQVEYTLTDNGKTYDGKSSVGISYVGKALGNSKQDISKKDYSNQDLVTAKADNEISKLYYQYLKKYSIPVLNNNVLRTKIAELEKLRGAEWCVRYLTFMLEHYEFADFKYKPEISDALDLYRKSKSIETAMIKQLQIGKVY